MSRNLILLFFAAGLGAGETYQTDVVYGQAGGVDLKMDIAFPADRSKPVPAVVCIHGGGWIEGNKKQFGAVAKAMAKSGFVAITIDYRLAPRFPMPAQVEDAKCSVRYLRTHATELGIDPAHIGAVGGSAGGHLALMLGLSGSVPKLEGSGGNAEADSRVQAVVNLSGPSNMSADAWDPRGIKSVYKASTDVTRAILFGPNANADILVSFSPITYVDAHDPPVLTVHGSTDTVVPLAQSQRLHAKLLEVGVTEHLTVLDGVGHNIASGAVKGVCGEAIRFLQQHLLKPK
ncbi:MAG: alpha/beta hydrolase [Planctomycetota bacterium]